MIFFQVNIEKEWSNRSTGLTKFFCETRWIVKCGNVHKKDCVNQKKYTIRWFYKNKSNTKNQKCTKNISKKPENSRKWQECDIVRLR